jgi:hypothetical protein
MMDNEVAEVEQNKEVVVEDKKEDVNPIEEAKKILEETKKTLSQITDERKRIEKATAEMLINGRSYAGQIKKNETADEKWEREAEIRYAGTGMSPVPTKK